MITFIDNKYSNLSLIQDTVHPMLNAYKVKTPSHYVLAVLREIRSRFLLLIIYICYKCVNYNYKYRKISK